MHPIPSNDKNNNIKCLYSAFIWRGYIVNLCLSSVVNIFLRFFQKSRTLVLKFLENLWGTLFCVWFYWLPLELQEQPTNITCTGRLLQCGIIAFILYLLSINICIQMTSWTKSVQFCNHVILSRSRFTHVRSLIWDIFA